MNDPLITSPGVSPEIKMIARVNVAPWAEQPRRHFDAGKLDELAASMRAHGFLARSPLLVRTRKRLLAIPDADYEIIAGERRWRASELAGIEMVPCVVSEMTDAQALEIVLVENLQRDDLTPMEESEGYSQLLLMTGEDGEMLHSVESLARKLGRSRQHLSRRLGLRRLRGSEAGKALEDGRLPISHAELVSMLPTTSLQDEVCRKILKPAYGPGPLTSTQTEQLIRDEYQRGLKAGKFDQSAEALVAVLLNEAGERVSGGACGDCPQNSKNIPEETQGRKEAMCRNPECYRAKEAAAHELWRASVAAENAEVQTLPEEKEAALWDYTGEGLGYNSGMVEIDTIPANWELAQGVDPAAAPTFRAIAEAAGVPVVLARDKAGKVHELVARDLAMAAARELHPEIFKGKPQPKTETQQNADELERTRLREEQRRVLAASEQEIVQAVLRKGVPNEVFLNLIFEALLENHATSDEIAEGLGWTANDEDDNECAGVEYLAAHFAPLAVPQKCALLTQSAIRSYWIEGGDRFSALHRWAEPYGVDLAAIEARVRGELAAEAVASGLTWTTRKEEVEDYEWNEHGVCTNPDVCSLDFGKKDKTVAIVSVGRGVKGWYVGHSVHFGRQGELALVSSIDLAYSDRSVALRSGLLAVREFLEGQPLAVKQQARVNAWLGEEDEAVREPSGKLEPEKALESMGLLSTAPKDQADEPLPRFAATSWTVPLRTPEPPAPTYEAATIWREGWPISEQAKYPTAWLTECLALGTCDLPFPQDTGIRVTVLVAQREEGFLWGLDAYSDEWNYPIAVPEEVDGALTFYSKSKWHALDMALLQLEGGFGGVDVDLAGYNRLSRYMEIANDEIAKDEKEAPAPAGMPEKKAKKAKGKKGGAK